jgi:hypothetical protein
MTSSAYDLIIPSPLISCYKENKDFIKERALVTIRAKLKDEIKEKMRAKNLNDTDIYRFITNPYLDLNVKINKIKEYVEFSFSPNSSIYEQDFQKRLHNFSNHPFLEIKSITKSRVNDIKRVHDFSIGCQAHYFHDTKNDDHRIQFLFKWSF